MADDEPAKRTARRRWLITVILVVLVGMAGTASSPKVEHYYQCPLTARDRIVITRLGITLSDRVTTNRVSAWAETSGISDATAGQCGWTPISTVTTRLFSAPRFGESMAPMILHRLHHGALQQSDLKAKAALRDHQQAILAPHAAAMAIELPGGDHKDGVISSVTSRWAGYDSEGALSWIETLPDGEQRNQALQGLITGFASFEPETAATYVASLPPGLGQEKAAITVMRRWASIEPTPAAQWAAQFPEGHARQNAMRTLMTTWGRSDLTPPAVFSARCPMGHPVPAPLMRSSMPRIPVIRPRRPHG